jgi:hypothetical protein
MKKLFTMLTAVFLSANAFAAAVEITDMLEKKTYSEVGQYGGSWSNTAVKDWSEYEYVWMKYSGNTGSFRFGLTYSEWYSPNYGGQYRDQVADISGASGIAAIKIDHVSRYEKGDAETDGNYIGEIYSKYIRNIFIQTFANNTPSITIDGIFVGSKSDYEKALGIDRWADGLVAYEKIAPVTNPTVAQAQGGVYAFDVPAGDRWASQFFIGAKLPIPKGLPIKISFEYKADQAVDVGTQSHSEPGNMIGWDAFGHLQFTTSWKTFETEYTSPRDDFRAMALDLAQNGKNVKYEFKNIKVSVALSLDQVTNPTLQYGLTFEGGGHRASTWTEDTKTFSWGSGGYNGAWTFITAQGVSGDVSDWTKLHLKVSNFDNSKENKLNVVFKENDPSGNHAGPTTELEVTPDANGNIDIDLTKVKWTCNKKDLEDLTIYGLERTDASKDGSVKITEAWYATANPYYEKSSSLNIPDTDPIIVSAKSALLTAINKAKNTNLLGKTTASKNALAAAVAAGTALVGTEGGEVAEIDAAREAVLNAIYELQDRTAPTAEKEAPKGWKSVITNGNLEGKDMSCFSAKVADAKDATECETADYEGIDDFHALFVQSNAAIKTQDWSDQLFITATETIPAGTKIHVEFDYRSDVEATAETQSHNLAGQYIHYAAIGNVNFKPEWQHFNYDGAVVAECNGGDNNGGYKNDFRTIAFNLSKNGKNTKFFIDNVVFWIELPKVQKQVLENGDLEGEETSNYMVKVYPSSAIVPATLTEGAGKDGSKGIKIDAPKKVSQDWDSQFWIQLPYESVPAGTSIKVKFDYKASAAASVDTQTHEAPGNYIHYAAIGTLNFTTDWNTFEGTFAVPSQCNGSDNSSGYKNNFRSIAFNLAKGTANDDVTFYFDNFSMTMDEEVADELTVVTGIKNVQPAAVKAGQYYDLLGRPVAQPRKGLYILNGQKVAVK